MASLADLALPISIPAPAESTAASAPEQETPAAQPTDEPVAGPSNPPKSHSGGDGRPPPKKRRHVAEADLLPMDEISLKRLTVIKEGDNVLLRLPSDQVKAVVASKDGCVYLSSPPLPLRYALVPP